MSATTEDSGGDPLSAVLRERVDDLEARFAVLTDQVEMGDDIVKKTRLRVARQYIQACRELLDEEVD